MRKLGILTAALSCVLAACGGGSTCERANDAYAQLNQNVGDCQGTGLPVSFDQKICEQNIDRCTSEEQDVMRSYFDCLDRVGTCQAGNEATWADAVNACQPLISTACATALNPQ
jgi:hypothetical protein